ncbi:MAG: peptidase dimerization domain-containing protein [Candidatus Moduliflexus flocculans]|nr:peptidase dimerization domain-containing protein [Candidatus Moduliflexus flocculans]
MENGILYARGACDEKDSTPGMVYGLAIARDLGLLDGYTAYYFGNMEEWCDGIAPNAFVEADPKVQARFCGHRRADQDAGLPRAQGTHRVEDHRQRPVGARGLALPGRQRRVQDDGDHHPDPRTGPPDALWHGLSPGAGHPSIAVTDVSARTASLNAVPDQFTIYLDRRITSNEPRDEVIAQIKGLIPDYLQDEIQVEELFYDAPSYTGFVFPVSKFYPPWLLDDAHPLTQAGTAHDRGAVGREAAAGHVGFLDQRHLLGRQGGHPVHRLWSRRREDRAHDQSKTCRSMRWSRRPSSMRCLPSMLSKQVNK